MAQGRRLLITGAHGFIGTAFARAAETAGYETVSLRRGSGSSGSPTWDPQRKLLDPEAIEGFYGIVHLAGESIAGGRWTKRKKERILQSRIDGTSLLCQTVAKLKRPPQVIISASAVGYYGDTGDRVVDETSPRGNGFLADVCVEWESSAGQFLPAGVRLIHPRFGIVLGHGGGALAAMLPVFRLGLGGPLGSGAQYMSWVTIGDVCRALLFGLDRNELSGPINVVSPNPVTNAEFTRELGAALHRPAFLRAPAWALKLALGDLADEALLAGQRAVPKQLLSHQFSFDEPDLPAALTKAVSPIRHGN